MKMKKWKEMNKKWKEYAFAGCICILFFVCISNIGKLWSAFSGFLRIFKPLFLGFIFAYIMNPIAVFIEEKLFRKIKKEKLKWNLSVLITILLTILVFGLLIILLIPQIAKSLRSLAENYTTYIMQLKNFVLRLQIPLLNQELITEWMDSIYEEGGLLSKIGTLISENTHVIIEKTTTIGTSAINTLIGGIFAIYFLNAKENILNYFRKLFSLLLTKERFHEMGTLAAKFNTIFSKYIVCELADALIIGALNAVFMKIFRMPYVLIISVIVAVTNLIPTFGPLIGGGIGAFILLLIKPTAVIPFLIFTLIVQTLDAYLIKPKLFGNALNVPGVLILIAIIIFGKLMGVTGMLLAIPFAAILVYLYTERLVPWLEKRKKKELDTEEKEAPVVQE